MSSPLAEALADLFNHTATIYDIAGSPNGNERNYKDNALHEAIPAIYGPMLASRLQMPATFDPEAQSVDQLLLNAPFPDLKTGMILMLKKGDWEKRFYVQDATVTELDFTLVAMTPRRKK